MSNEKKLNLEGLIYLVNNLKNKHLKVTALSEAGIHGIRYYQNKLQGYDSTGEEWFDITDDHLSSLVGSDSLSTDAETLTGAINELRTAISNIAITWNDISGKPSAFMPTSHTHDDRYYTKEEVDNIASGIATGDVDLSNYVTNSDLSSIVGAADLTTDATTLKEAINELKGLIGSGGGSANIPVDPSSTDGLTMWIETI